MPFLSGAYTVQYGGATIGQINGGQVIEHFVNKQLVTGDNRGLTPQDSVFQGEEVFMEMQLMEYDQAQAKVAFWPYAAQYGQAGIVGTLDVVSALTKIIVLTAVAGTPAAAAGDPATLTAGREILAEGFPVRILFGPNTREVALRFRLYPQLNGFFFDQTS